MKPKIFIGSSVEGLTIAYALQQNLTHTAEVTVWDQGVFDLSSTTIESLVERLEKCDFAIFVFSNDDITKIRGNEFQTVRDNVIFELGLFIGKLGRSRTFIVMPEGVPLHLPTDLLGMTVGKYDSKREDGSFQAATGPVCHQIRQKVVKIGSLNNDISDMSNQKESTEINIGDLQTETDWWILFNEQNFVDAGKAIKKAIIQSKGTVTEQLHLWEIYIGYKIDPSGGVKNLLEKFEAVSKTKTMYRVTARIFLMEDELELANKILDEGLKKFKLDPVLILRKTIYLEKFGKKEEGIDFLQNQDYASNPSLVLRLAELYENSENKDINKAYEAVLKSLKINSNSEELMSKLGDLAHDVNRDNVALYLFDKLTKKFPEDDTYWCRLGNVCIALDFDNKAMLAYQKAEQLSRQDDPWIWENIGNLLEFKGLYAESKGYFKKALEIDPNSNYSFSHISSIIKNEEIEDKNYQEAAKKGLVEMSELKETS